MTGIKDGARGETIENALLHIHSGFKNLCNARNFWVKTLYWSEFLRV